MYRIVNITDSLSKINKYHNRSITFFDRSKVNPQIKLEPGEQYVLNGNTIDRSLLRLKNLKYITIIEIKNEGGGDKTNETVSLENKRIPVDIIRDNENKFTIIIPTFNNVNYIDDCMDSIMAATENCILDIIIGIDNCEKTKRHIEDNSSKYDNTSVIFFNKNVGPYRVKNTLIQYAKYDEIIFFDSDDIMTKLFISETLKHKSTSHHIKYGYKNFNNNRGYRSNINNNLHSLAEGIIYIRKDVFLKLNGFRPWPCSGDSEFNDRLKYHGYKTKGIKQLCVHRRIHGENLTLRKDTGHRTKIRRDHDILMKEIKENNYYNPEILHIEENHYFL